VLVLLDLGLTIAWLAIVIGLFATSGPVETFEQATSFYLLLASC
jgi:hypothetical protein